MNYPDHWLEVSFEELLIKLTNGTTLTQHKEPPGIPVSRIETISNATVNFGKVCFIRELTTEQKEKFLLRKGDILFSHINSDSHLGKCAIYRGGRELLHGMNLLLMRSSEHYCSEFLQQFLGYLRAGGYFMRIAQHAVNQSSLNQKKLNQISIPLPPLKEQKRIVAKIEELFSELDAGEESLRKARRQLGVYRQSLLKQTFEGKLTACGKMKKFPLRSLITNLGQGWSPKCELNRRPEPDEWAIIKTTAIQHCRYDDSEAKPLPPPFKPRPAIEIRDGDFLMTRKGPRTRAGVSCYVRHTRQRLMICDTVYRFRCVEEKVYPLYLELALNSPDILQTIDELKAGISESGLSLTHTKIGTVEIPLCSLAEQQEIVCLIDEQFTVIEQNEREIDTALKRSEALRQSILKKAFSGQLVPQDPAYEPAGVLLERIRKEREAPRKPPTKTLIRLRTAKP